MPITGAILGATGSGKTEIAAIVASRTNAEIICMDSRQVFKGFRIGTAQPSEKELKTAKHHLVDFLSPENSYSAANFAEDVKDLLRQKPDTNFILVGGTGLYLQALCRGLSPLPAPNAEIRAKLIKKYNNRENLYSDSVKIDPAIKGKIMPSDTQRLLRVLELWEQGVLFSEPPQRTGGIGSIPQVWLNFPREELYRRINKRVLQMFANDWVGEIKALSKTVAPNAPAWQSLGYCEIKELLNLNKDPFLAADEIAKKSRNYAKRQLTWFRNQEKPFFIDGRRVKEPENIDLIIERLGLDSKR